MFWTTHCNIFEDLTYPLTSLDNSLVKRILTTVLYDLNCLISIADRCWKPGNVPQESCRRQHASSLTRNTRRSLKRRS